jgi:hypothetical protein
VKLGRRSPTSTRDHVAEEEAVVKPLYRIHKAVDGTTLHAAATAVLPPGEWGNGFAAVRLPKLAKLNPEGWFIRKTERRSLRALGTPR